ncbi:class I SAM-dependent methyltransferase [Candidatus Zixiibacteriota bacterium]
MTVTGEWYDDDVLWETLTPHMFSAGIMASAPEEVDQVLALLKCASPAAILDLCCGAGRHSIELARRGFQVTGVDRTASYLDRAKEHAGNHDVQVEFIQKDMRRFRRDDTYDAAINMFTSFGYFADPHDDRQVLANVCHSLKPGGRFILEIMGKEILARIFKTRDWHETENGVLFLQERKVTNDWSWMENRWILIKDRDRKEFNISHRIYSAAELTTAMQKSGFTEVIIYGDLAGAPYDQEAKRLVAVGRK